MEILKYTLPNNNTNGFEWLRGLIGRFNCVRYNVAMVVDTDFCKLDLYSQSLLAAPYKINFFYGCLPDLNHKIDILIIGSTDPIFIQGFMGLFNMAKLVCLPHWESTIQAQVQPLEFRGDFEFHYCTIKQTINTKLKHQMGNLWQTQPLQTKMVKATWKQVEANNKQLKTELEQLEKFKTTCLDSKFL